MSYRKPFANALFVLALLGGAACGGADDDSDGDSAGSGSASSTAEGDVDAGGVAEAEKVVIVRDDLFEPGEVAIASGDTVKWEWEGENPHNVQGDDFKSEIQTSGSFEHTFESVGTFEYICQVHPSMKASVVVAGG